MGGLVLDGTELHIAGVDVLNWRDDPAIELTSWQWRPRSIGWTPLIVLHTTKGIPGGSDRRPQEIRPGAGPGGNARGTIAWWNREQRYGSAPIVIDHDGSVLCCADVTRHVCYHATALNERSIGVELYQGSQAELYEHQLDVAVRVIDALCRELGIQRQIHHPYKGSLSRIHDGQGCVGVIGHRDQHDCNRGPGDPGDAIMERLVEAGYERFDFDVSEDVKVWRKRQEDLNELADAGLTVDGIPGPATVAALEAAGFGDGLWTSKPKVWQILDMCRQTWPELEGSPRLFAKLAEWFGAIR